MASVFYGGVPYGDKVATRGCAEQEGCFKRPNRQADTPTLELAARPLPMLYVRAWRHHNEGVDHE